MKNIYKDHMLSLFAKGFREDGRKFDEYRNVEVEYGISAKSAEGSARVKIGNTEVVAGVKMATMKPYPDQPNKGTLMVNVELISLASKKFRLGPPSIDSIEISRVVDRGIRESESIDFSKLCIKEGENVWVVTIDIYPINDGGNLFDAAGLAALAAIKDAKMPKLNEDGSVDYNEKTKESVPMTKMPVEITVIKIGETLFVDPTASEELNSDARLTVAVLEDGKLCALQKGGDVAFTAEEIVEAVDLAVKKSKELRKALK